LRRHSLAAERLFTGDLEAGQQFNFMGDFGQRHFFLQLAHEFDDRFSAAHIEIIQHHQKK
jgi:uncharacterized protein (DUF2249 family)